MSQPVVICDTGPLLVLGKLNRLELLPQLYSNLKIPQVVYQEAVEKGEHKGSPDAVTIRLFLQAYPEYLTQTPLNTDYRPEATLGAGEIAVLTLGQQLPYALLLLDDEAAREEARRLGLSARGSLGILAQAYRHHLLSLAQVERMIHIIISRPDIWIAEKLCHQVLNALHVEYPSQ